METNPFAPDFDDLPEELPIFPLAGVLLLPRGSLPLNIFEPRYVAMVEDALRGNRLIGMIQTKTAEDGADDDIFTVGCAGKITEFSETVDGRYEIKLAGISRFKIAEELSKNSKGYRRVRTSWTDYEGDLKAKTCLDLDREKLKSLLQKYFHKQGMDCDWYAVDEADDGKLITCLSMVCPFTPCEKQALLEAGCCHDRGEKFMTMLEMAACDEGGCKHKH